MGGLGQMVCSCGSFSIICQWSHTDLENFLPSHEYEDTTGRKDLGSVEVSVMRVEEGFRNVASDHS